MDVESQSRESSSDISVSELFMMLQVQKRWWQTIRIETLDQGINAYVELKPELTWIPELMGISCSRAILSVTQRRVDRYCVMRDGRSDSQKWFGDLQVAVEQLLRLV